MRALHASHAARCFATSRGIRSPSHSAETHSAAFSQFTLPPSFRQTLHAKSAAILRAPQRPATSRCQRVFPRSLPAPHTTALPQASATAATAARHRVLQTRPRRTTMFPPHILPSPTLVHPRWASAAATIRLLAFFQFRRDTPAAISFPDEIRSACAKGARRSPARRLRRPVCFQGVAGGNRSDAKHFPDRTRRMPRRHLDKCAPTVRGHQARFFSTKSFVNTAKKVHQYNPILARE